MCPIASECKNGNANIAPLALRNFLRGRFMDSFLASRFRRVAAKLRILGTGR